MMLLIRESWKIIFRAVRLTSVLNKKDSFSVHVPLTYICNSAVKLHAITNLQHSLSHMRSVLGFYPIVVYLLLISSVIRLYITLIGKSFSMSRYQHFSGGLYECVGGVLQCLYYVWCYLIFMVLIWMRQ